MPTSIYARWLEPVVDLVVGDMVEPALDGLDVIAEDHAGLVDEVDAPVVQHAAAVFLDASPVGGNPAAAVDAALDVDDLADLAGIVDLLHSEGVHVKAAVLVNGEDLPGLVRRGDHALQGFHGQRHRLFGDHVLPGLQSRDGDFLVHVVGRGDGDHVDGGIRQQRLSRFVDLHPVRGGLGLLGRIDVVNAGEFHNVAGQNILDVKAGAHSAVSDHCCVFLHSRHSISPTADAAV